jgi:hypothetical protein
MATARVASVSPVWRAHLQRGTSNLRADQLFVGRLEGVGLAATRPEIR